jgi:hypothetical protein
MVLHPLGEISLMLGWANGRVVGRIRGRPGGIVLGGPSLGALVGALLSRGACLGALLPSPPARERRHACEQHTQCRSETEPGWETPFHDVCGALSGTAVLALAIGEVYCEGRGLRISFVTSGTGLSKTGM